MTRRCTVCWRPEDVPWPEWVAEHGFPCGHCDDHYEESPDD